MKNQIGLIVTLLLLSTSLFANNTELKIGIKSHTGKELAIKKWNETIKALDIAIPNYKISMVPIVTFENIEKAIKNKDIDFILTNPAQYIALEKLYKARKIATLKNLRYADGITKFASVIFAKSDRIDINNLKDIRNKSIMGVDKRAFGGWYMSLNLLRKNGVYPFKEANVAFQAQSTQREVVEAVVDGLVDVGVVRTGIIEKLIKNGKISENSIKVINLQNNDFPLMHSTKLYPEWAFASLSHTNLDLAKKITVALYEIKPNDIAAVAGNYTGWSIPLDYSDVHNILKELKVFPYEHYGEITLESLYKEYKYLMLFILLLIILLLIINTYITKLNVRLRERSKKLKQSNYELNQVTAELTEFSRKLEERVKEEVDKNQQKDRLVFQQSKMASMGEMIGNIAHQWRQPISIISMLANNIIADVDMEEIENDNLRKYADNINEQTTHLSQVIDDFRNFFIPNKEKSTFKLQGCIDKTMHLLAASFKTHQIEVIENIEDINITAIENELTQAVLNIINNSKDILVTLSKDKKRLIFIDIYQKENLIIKIRDSGGGVPNNIVDKVFEPYFTTKHKSQGTGIGLYMTESIVTKHLHGHIEVKNIEYIYKNINYIGAEFIITIPFNR